MVAGNGCRSGNLRENEDSQVTSTDHFYKLDSGKELLIGRSSTMVFLTITINKRLVKRMSMHIPHHETPCRRRRRCRRRDGGRMTGRPRTAAAPSTSRMGALLSPPSVATLSAAAASSPERTWRLWNSRTEPSCPLVSCNKNKVRLSLDINWRFTTTDNIPWQQVYIMKHSICPCVIHVCVHMLCTSTY